MKQDRPVWRPVADFLAFVGSPPFLQFPPRTAPDFAPVRAVPQRWQPANDDTFNPSPEAA